MLLAKWAMVLASCLVSASVGSRSATDVETMNIQSGVISEGGVEPVRQALVDVVADGREVESSMDFWLSLMVGAGLVVVLLNRKQKALQAPKLLV